MWIFPIWHALLILCPALWINKSHFTEVKIILKSCQLGLTSGYVFHRVMHLQGRQFHSAVWPSLMDTLPTMIITGHILELSVGQCPWQVLQHICLKYARLQNLNFSTNGQYATLFTSLHSSNKRKTSEIQVQRKLNV